MKILTVAAEVAPFAKTGGLADVTASLSKALDQRGHEVAIILPKYLMVDRGGYPTELIDLPLSFRIDNEDRTGWIHRAKFPGASITVYFVANDFYYNRNGIYHDGGRDYPDNLARFTFFCRAVIEFIRSGEFTPDIVHCHDWQTSLVPTYLKTTEKDVQSLSNLKTVFTVHNLAFQGFFPREQFPATGLPWHTFTQEGLEFFGDLNLLKAGFVYSDAITTVSERYAIEMMTPEYGCGMESIVSACRHRLTGILNGVDYEVWNPQNDPMIVSHYSPEDLSGKSRCKAALQEQFGLPVREDVPIFASISRFDDQKGLDLIYHAMEMLLFEGDLQLVVLGEGKPEYERLFNDLNSRFPHQVSLYVGHNEECAHRMLSGADLFLMPSRYEPCGLVQLYSLKYGTPPIVRQAGGLADTVRDYNDAQRDGYGFVFNQAETKDFLQAIGRALAVYRDRTAWTALQRRGMACDFSWGRSADKYEHLFESLVEDYS
ncbi:glycogen synthase GlgA [bacterium]|nr:glycogen synthase GlgA [bacterium]MCK6495073.1 glycogen synthase GlgA [bacterium]